MKKLFAIFITIILVFISVIAFADNHQKAPNNQNPLNLTEEEIQFLVDHPIMRVSNEMDLVPYDYVENGQPAGLSVELLQEIAEIIGVEFEFINGYSWDELLEMFKNREIDLIHPCTKVKDRLDYLSYSNPYMQLKLVLVVQDSNYNINSFDDMSGKTIASVIGYSSYEIYKNLYPDMNILEVPDEASAFNAVKNGDVDAYYTDKRIATKFIDELNINNLKLIETYIFEIIDASYKSIGIRGDWQLLTGIINKAIDAVSLTKKYEISSKYDMELDIFYGDENFTDVELDWLKEHPVIRVSNGLDWYPFDYVEDGQPAGISIEYMKVIAEILGVEFKFLNGYTWNERMKMFKNKQIDVMNIIRKNDERLEYTAFTEPYIQEKKGIVVNINNDDISDSNDLHDKTFAIVTGYASTKDITSRFPNIITLEFSSDEEAINAVVTGKVDAYYGSEISTNAIIETGNLRNLDMKYYLYSAEDTNLFSIGIRGDWEIFRDIINKTMKKIPASTKQKIADNYGMDIDVFYDGDVLTLSEIGWLKNNPVINIAVPFDYMPYVRVDKNGNIEGIVGDLLIEMEKRLDVEFILYPKSLTNALVALDTEIVDVISPVAITDKRSEVYSFSEAFFIAPIAIFSNDNYSFVTNIELQDLKVFTIENHAIIEMLENDYLNIETIEVKNTTDALRQLEKGEKAVFLGDLIETNSIINREEFENVKVIGYTNYYYNLAFAMSHDNQILQSVINKTLKSIFAETGDSIQQKWLATNEKVDITKYIVIIIISLIVIVILLVLVRIILKINKEKQINITLMDIEILYIEIDTKYIILNVSTALINLLNIDGDNYKGKNIKDIDLFYIEFSDTEKKLLQISISDEDMGLTSNKKTLYLEYEVFRNSIGKDGYKIIFDDITSHVLREANIKAESDSRAKSEFLAIISHEIRTPLSTIMGLSHLLSHEDQEQNQRKYNQKIYQAGSSLLSIINDMLDITKFESGKLDVEYLPFDFGLFIENIITMNKMKAEEKGHKFSYDIGCNIPNNLVGDALRLGQVLGNILSNAIKFTHNGEISISVHLVGRTLHEIDLKFVIRDTGIGMSKEQLSKVFVPFEQADKSFSRKYGGTGLGMSITKQLIELMGGEIEVDSVQGDGTIFILNLNFALDEAIHKTQKKLYETNEIAENLKIIQGKKILIVEDNKVNQEILTDILSFYKLQIDTAGNGIEALEKLVNNYYDLIFMDIQMPKMDGLTTTRKIRDMDDERMKDVPILAMTAHAMQEEFQKSIDAGMNAHLTKPINIEMLEESLIEFLIDKKPPHIMAKPKISEKKVNTISIMSNPDNLRIIDVRMGLLRLHHDKDLYRKSLLNFLEFKDADNQIYKMLDEEDIDEAIRLAHSVKGVAANLSLDLLSKAAHNLKEKLSLKSDEAMHELNCFSKILIKTMKCIESDETLEELEL